MNFNDTLEEADDLFKERHFRLALKVLRRVESELSESADYQNRVGMCFTFLGGYQAARVHYRKAIRLEYDRASFWCNLAHAYQMEENFDRAAKLYEQSFLLGHHGAGTYEQYAVCLLELGWPVKALEYVNKAIEMKPNSSLIKETRGRILAQLKRPEEVIASCLEAFRNKDRCVSHTRPRKQPKERGLNGIEFNYPALVR